MYPVSLLITRREPVKELELVRTSLLESYPHDGQSRLSWDARSTLSSKKYRASGY